MILDQPAASLDSETEALIMQGLNRLTTERTYLIEQGSFAELIAAGGAFASLYRTQFGRPEEEHRAVT